MGKQLDEFDRPNMTRLDQLEAAFGDGEPWSRADQAWLVAELRKAWARLAESDAWSPVDPSWIG